MRKIILAACLWALCSTVMAKPYAVDYANSKITFAGQHAGKSFSGEFKSWQAAIDFDPANLPGSKISASFDLASAKTGDAMYDGTLPSADWFDVKNTPRAEFVTSSIRANPDGSYSASGNLTLRGVSKPVEFTFTLSDLNAPPVRVTAQFPIDRLAYAIGQKSDASAEWVSKTITIELQLSARPAP